MSSVLRKKIEAGAGIPPTILQFHEFWEPLLAVVNAWAFNTFGPDAKAVCDIRRVVPGNIASSQLEAELAFFFSARTSPGLCAVAVDEIAACTNAAVRLQQSTSDLAGVSPLFQKLLFETSAIELWRLAAGELSGHSVFGSQSPLCDCSQSAGGFDPAERYLMAGFTCVLNDQRARVWVVFLLDYVQRQSVEAQQSPSQQPKTGSEKARDTLRESVKSTMISIEGVLDRIPMTIGQCSRLEIGQLIALPDVDTTRVSLQAETVNGHVDIGECEMGVWKSQRALKLKTPILEPFTRELAKL